MKKLIALLLIAGIAIMTTGPALTAGTGNGDVDTNLTRGQGGGSDPIIKTKWEMKTCTQGEDDSTDPGAQFDAPGVWGAEMEYTVCAIATDPNGAVDIDGVYADIYYPENRAFHPHPGYPDVIGGGTPSVPDYGIDGCGAFIEENTLLQLPKMEGYQLFCEDIRTNNNNLPVFFGAYNYDEICGPEGELMKEEAYVYCDQKSITWEDPAGMYRVKVFAQDQAGNSSQDAVNYFEYLPFTGFDVDFNAVSYGEVLLNVHKKISGDKTFGTTDKPTVRNTGNTRLNMWVAQDDMALGQSSGLWNVEYDARVGNNEEDWGYYSPFKFKGDPGIPGPYDYEQLEDILDLSEEEEMDFSILVTKWPDGGDYYVGEMWLSAAMADYRQCVEQ
ncbi:hypothetical protein KAU51_02025 [Candidatus Parcubacteria bacterium]|nr:hypothetical protein [Candidatus Parcubacteria bacterium]